MQPYSYPYHSIASLPRRRSVAHNLHSCALALAGVAAALAGGQTARGQTSGTWTTAGNGTWSTTTNWAGGTVADGAGAVADFGTVNITANATITLDSNRTIGQLIFGDTVWANSGFGWTLQSGTLTLDNTGGTGGNPPSITGLTGVAATPNTISSILAGSDGLSFALPWSNYDSTRGTTSAGGNGGASQTSGGLTFTGSNTLSGSLSVSGGAVRVGGAAGRFGSATALSVTGNGSFLNGDATAANNNGLTNRIGDGTAPLSLGGASGAGTYTSAFAAAGNTASQTFADLTINAGHNQLATANTAAGTNNLIFTGVGGAGYVRTTNGLVNVAAATGFNPQFTNAPTAAGGSSVSGAGSDAILIGATLSGSDFIAAASGNLAAATYTTNGATSLTSGANINITGGNTTLPGSTTVSVNSIKFTDNAARTLNLGAGSALTVASGGILTGAAVATTGNTITGGSITSGQGDLWIYANGSGLSNPRVSGNALTIASQVTGNISVTVGGGVGQAGFGQQVVFSNATNDYTGGTFLTGGMLSIGADGALGSTSGAVTAVSGLNYLAPSASFTFSASRNFVVNSGAALFIGGRGQTTTIAGQLSGGGQFGPGYVSSGDLLTLTGNNSGFTGQYMVNGRLNATEGMGLSSNANLMFTGRGGFGGGRLETSGTFTRSLGSGAGQVQWQVDGQYGTGGFAAVGGALDVNIGGNATPDTLTWGSGYFLAGSGQQLVLGSGASTHDVTVENSIALNGGQRGIVVSSSGDTRAILSGVLSGNASSGINKLSTGTLVLSGFNTYQGKTAIGGGTLSVLSLNSVSGGNASSSLGAPTTSANGTIDVGSAATAGTLLYTGTGETTDRVVNLAGTTGGATLDQSGDGLLKFTSALTATGSGAKTLTLQGSTAGTGEIAGAIVNYTGAGGPLATGVTKAGTGTWTLSGANTYTGTTAINAGTLQIGNGSTTGGLSASSAITGSSGATLAFNRSDNYGGTFANTVGGGLGLTLSSGSLTLSASNTYTGTTTINAGTLEIASTGRLGSAGTYSGGLANNGTFIYSGTNNQTISGLTTGSGSFTHNAASTLTFSGSMALSGAANAISTTANGAIAIEGNLATAPESVLTLTVGGGASTGLIRLTGTGNIQGEVIVTGGSGSSSALVWQNTSGVNSLNGATKITVASGNTLRYWSASIGAETAFDLNGTGNGGRGALNFYDSGTSTISGPVNLSGNSSITSRNAALTLGGNVTESGGARALTITADAGGGTTQVYTLSGSNSFTGGLNFNGENSAGFNATLVAGSATAFGSGPLALNSLTQATASAIVDLNGQAITVGGLSGGNLANANSFIQSDSGAAALTVNQATNGTFSGVIRNGSGSVALTKSGNATLTLAGANTYSGQTTISGGVLALGAAGSFANSSAIIVGDAGSSGAVLDLTAKSGAFSIGAGQLLGGGGTVQLAASGALTVLGTFSPGNSPGLFAFDAGTTELAGTTLMEVFGTTRATSPSHGTGFYDAVDVVNNGILQFGGTLTLEFSSLFDNNTTFDLFTPESGSSLAGNFTGVNVGGSFYTGLDWNQTGGVWKSSNTAGGQSLEFSSVTGQLVIVPEPGAIALAGIGIAAAAWLLRRRQKECTPTATSRQKPGDPCHT